MTMQKIAKRQNCGFLSKEKNGADPKKRRGDCGRHESGCIDNEIGITQFLAGHHLDARRSFIEALRREQKIKLTQFAPSPIIKTLLQKELNLVAQCERSFQTKLQEDEKSQPYIDRRQDCDEGMSVYTTTLQANNSLPSGLRCATFLYNIGQTWTATKEYEKAKKLFESALLMITEHKNRVDDATQVNIVKILHNVGHCHYYLGQNEASKMHYSNALAHALTLGLSKQDLAGSCRCTAVTHLYSGPSEYATAFKLFHQSLSIYQKLPGDFSKEIGTLLNNIGRVHYMREEFSDALKVHQRALTIRRQRLGRGSNDVAVSVLNTAHSYYKIGSLDEAMKLYQEFVDLKEFLNGRNRRNIAAALKCMGRICDQRSEKEKARLFFEQALNSERSALGRFHPELASTLNHLGVLCYKLNDVKAALNYLKEGLTIEKTSLQSNIRNIIKTLLTIAQIQSDSGDYDYAIKSYNEAKILQVKVHGKCSSEVELTNFNTAILLHKMATVLLDFDEEDEAIRLYRESLCLKVASLGQNHPSLFSTHENLGFLYEKCGEFDEALEQLTKALEIEQKKSIKTPITSFGLLNAIGKIHFMRGSTAEMMECFAEAMRLRNSWHSEHQETLCLSVKCNKVFALSKLYPACSKAA